MVEYIYKGFRLSYTISTINDLLPSTGAPTYEAHGNAIYLLNAPTPFTQIHLHAENETYEGAEYEIKQLLESHVDFELKNFQATLKVSAEE